MMLLTRRANWQQICEILLDIADECRVVPHYLWIEKPHHPVVVAELETLLRNLGLDEQWAFLEAEYEQLADVARTVDASDSSGSGAAPI